MSQQQASRPPAALSSGLVRLMAVTCAVAVANLYYAQPLLHVIGSSLHASQAAASLLVTAAQLGYAAGLLLVVPVGDIARRRPLLTALLTVDTAALAASAAVPDLGALGALAVIIGVTSVVVQMLVPYAATLATDGQRSRVIGTLMSGLLIGILLSRTFAGVIAQAAGWRAVYGAAAVVMALTTVALRVSLPDHPPELTVTYLEQMRGVLAVARAEPVLRWRSLMGACGFAAFGCFWTTVTFLLSGPRYGFSQLDIGLFALVGAAGAVTAAYGGRLLDARRELRWIASGAALALMAAGLPALGLDRRVGDGRCLPPPRPGRLASGPPPRARRHYRHPPGTRDLPHPRLAEDLPGGEPDRGIGRHGEVVQRAVVDGGDDRRAGKSRTETFQQGPGRLTVQALGRLVGGQPGYRPAGVLARQPALPNRG